MSAAQNKGYKRSWKNLLLNKRYQLRFTLTMVGLSAVLMGLLGWWVMNVAERATKVAINNVLGEEVCKDPTAAAAAPETPAGQPAPAAAEAAPAEPVTDEAAEPAAPVTDEAAEPAEPVTDEAGEEERPVVTLEESEMELIAPPPSATTPAEDHAAAVKTFEACKQHQAAQIKRLEDRKQLIFWVLIAVGTMLVLGLLFYGIKMTHKVAGPLHKVSLYMAKLQAGTYDTVYNLRKGDHLVDFYDHFKAAHAGMVKWQEEDLARLEALIEAAEKDELAGRSPEAAAALAELRTLLERKRKGLGRPAEGDEADKEVNRG